MLKHPGIAMPVIEAFGQAGTRALNAISTREGRQLAHLVQDGWLSRTGRAAEVLAVIERFGDRALDFIWRHKGALTMASVLATFLHDPESFLNGTKEIAQAVADSTVRPLVEVPKQVTIDATSRIQWMVLIASLFVVLLGPSVLRRLRSRHN
jgi:hypothetical protein